MRAKGASVAEGFKVCRAVEVKVGDLILEPWSGAVARVTEVKREGAISPVKMVLLLQAARTVVKLELSEKRLVRRKLRDGET